MTGRYENAHAQVVTIEFSKKQEREPSTLRIFRRLKMYAYKKPRQSRRQAVSIQSALCEGVCLNNIVVFRIKYKSCLQKGCKQRE